jgi:hypothetical protein
VGSRSLARSRNRHCHGARQDGEQTPRGFTAFAAGRLWANRFYGDGNLLVADPRDNPKNVEAVLAGTFKP